MRKTWRHVKKIILWAAATAAAGFVVLVLVFVYYITRVPDISVWSARQVSESTKIYDRTGIVLLYDVHGEEKRTVIAWDKIPQNVRNATIAVEDSGFYTHGGIDYRGIMRALYRDITNFELGQGGSTITQQLVKNVLFTNDKRISRKIKEAILSIQVERTFSKDEILWMYLNQIPYGSNAYGIEAASQTYFGKHAQELTDSEAAILAALIQAPTRYSPYGSHTDELMARRNYVLDRMQMLGFLSEAAHDAAIAEKPQYKTIHDSMAIAQHFVIMVKDYLVQHYGEGVVQNSGMTVITTLDADLQGIAEDVVTKYGAINEKKYKATNAAFSAIDPKTGQVLALVGSRNYWDVDHEGNFNVVTARRQPGSSFKPFAYATAFMHGFTDSTMLFDLKTEFNPSCNPSGDQLYATGPCYHPQDYSGYYTGPVTMRQALDRSLNVPAVKTLYLAGISDTIQTAKAMGITTLEDESRFGLSLVLGGAEVRLLDMVSAYGVFANDGVRNPATLILKITASDGSTLEEYKLQEERVLDPQIARLMSDVLSDNDARAPVFGYNNALHLADRPVAAKTGTTQENRDGWLVGYTPSLAVGVWTGNNNNTPMTKEGAGVSAAGPMWNEFMRRALAGKPVEQFVRPDPRMGNKPVLNGDYRGPQGIHTILYYVDPNDPEGAPLLNPSSDPQFNNWEYGVRAWVAATGQPDFINPIPEYSPSPSPSPSPYPSTFPTPSPNY